MKNSFLKNMCDIGHKLFSVQHDENVPLHGDWEPIDSNGGIERPLVGTQDITTYTVLGVKIYNVSNRKYDRQP